MKATKPLNIVPLVVAIAVLPIGSTMQTARGEEASGDGWDFRVSPYFWFAGIEGDITVGGQNVEVDADFSDLWDALDFAGSLHFEAEKGKWGLILDPLYMDFSMDEEVILEQVAEAELTMWMVEFGGFYRLKEWETKRRGWGTTLDVLGGGRYWNVDREVEIGPFNPTSRDEWVDPWVGARVIAEMKDWLVIHARADVGGFDISSSTSKLTWNFYVGPAFILSDRLSIAAGYRWFDIEREDGDNELDLTFSGPLVALNFHF